MLSRGKTLSRTPIGWFVWRCAIQKKCQRGWGDRMTDCYCLFDADKSKDVVMLACWGLCVLNSASSLCCLGSQRCTSKWLSFIQSCLARGLDTHQREADCAMNMILHICFTYSIVWFLVHSYLLFLQVYRPQLHCLEYLLLPPH